MLFFKMIPNEAVSYSSCITCRANGISLMHGELHGENLALEVIHAVAQRLVRDLFVK